MLDYITLSFTYVHFTTIIIIHKTVYQEISIEDVINTSLVLKINIIG